MCGMDKMVKVFVEVFKGFFKDVVDEEFAKVVFIFVGGNMEVGEMIVVVMVKVGCKGVIFFEEVWFVDNNLIVVEGM